MSFAGRRVSLDDVLGCHFQFMIKLSYEVGARVGGCVARIKIIHRCWFRIRR